MPDITLPTDQGDSDVWGPILNTAITTVNTAVDAALVAADNLSDLASASTARTNLGLGTAATHPATDFASTYPWQFKVGDSGAVGDGKVVSDVTTTSSSAVITSATANFQTADVGKTVMINGANGTTSGPLVTTILSRQSATQVTLSANAGASATNCPMVYGTDDTAAINTAIGAASTYAQANQFFAEVVFDAKIYMLASGPTQTTSPAVQNSQLQIPFPAVSGATRKLVIALRGAGANGHAQYWESTAPNLAGTCLVSTLTSAPSTPDVTFGNQSVLGGPAGGGAFTGSFANTKVAVENISVWCPAYTNSYAFDFGYLAGCYVRQCSAHIFAAPGVGGGTSPLLKDLPAQANFQNKIGVGMRTPVCGNNADVVVDSFTVEGYSRGMYVFDHLTATRIFTFYNDVALKIDTALGISGVNHRISIANFGCEVYNGGISTTGSGGPYVPVFITMDAECSAPAYDVSDSGNILFGHLSWDDTTRSTPTITGAANLKIVNEGMGPGKWTGAPSVPASTVAATNTSYRDAVVVVTGGTVSAVSVDGVAQGYAATGFTVIVPAGKTVTLTYSVAPTWKWTLL